MAEGGFHRASGAQDVRRERPARWHGRPRACVTQERPADGTGDPGLRPGWRKVRRRSREDSSAGQGCREHILEHNIPLKTHVMLGGRIVESGGPELAAELHKKGYERIRAAYPEAAAAEKAMEDSRAELTSA